MREAEVIETVRDFVETQFPRSCTNCGKQFTSLASYLRETVHAGTPVSYDAERKDWQPQEPIGTVAMANCSCGNTLAITSHGMKQRTMWRLLLWARVESVKRGITIRALLADLRHKIDRSVLGEEAEG